MGEVWNATTPGGEPVYGPIVTGRLVAMILRSAVPGRGLTSAR
jgi:hypothetical protein